jgi:hypothetical protein
MDEPDWRPALAVTLRLTSVANLVEGYKRDLGQDASRFDINPLPRPCTL